MTSPDSGSSEDKPEQPSAEGGGEATPRAQDASDRSRSGTGFDTLLGRVLIERGFVSDEELQECLAKLASQGAPGGLPQALVSERLVTERQLQRLRSEMETDRASQHIPGYRIIKKLGAGAMATVYLAKQVSLDRLVAIKLLPRKFSADAKFIERFYKEGRAAARFNDQNIVGAYDVGQAGDQHYFVMEYVDGETVHDRVAKNGRLTEADAIGIVRQVASALKHAHAQGFIHRDIKPKNIMLSKAGVAKLADLGLARAVSDREAAEAEAGKAYGTPYYISPEQIRGRVDIGPAADLYGLGATFYHMVTGRVPFAGKTPNEVMNKHLKAPLTPPDHVNPQLTPGTAQIIEMLLAKDPADRYRDAGQLLEDLDHAARGESPEHARGTTDLAAVAATIAAAPPIEPTEIARVSSGGGGKAALVAALAASVLINLILLIVVLVG
jgi:tRNA A-37 threonylcarbamoyl transferase component Bud32